MLFAQLIFEGLADQKEMALKWINHVDGMNTCPKLPVHLCNQKDWFNQNQQIWKMHKAASTEGELVGSLNSALLSSPEIAAEEQLIEQQAIQFAVSEEAEQLMEQQDNQFAASNDTSQRQTTPSVGQDCTLLVPLFHNQ